jgi:VWFA-related protein
VTTRAIAAIALGTGLLAQGQTPTFKSRADLVQVDVIVVDKDNAPVRGLQQSDFILRDRGKPQDIATFDEVSRDTQRAQASAALPAGVPRDVSDNQDAQSSRLVVLVFDDLHIWRDRTERAKEIGRKVLAELGPQSSMAVLFTSGDHSTNLSTDHTALAAAIETFKGRQSWRRPHPSIDAQTGARLDPEMSAEQQLANINKTQSTKVQDFFDNMNQYKTLQDAARLLGGGDLRRKAFVLISEGIGKDLHGLFGAMATSGDIPEGGAGYAAGDVSALNSVAPTTYHDFALIDMMDAMRRSNVATYAIDPRGKVDSADLLRECSPAPAFGAAQNGGSGSAMGDPCSQGLSDFESPLRQAQSGLSILSEASGGFAVTNTNDFTGGLERIIQDLDHYYLLGFYPADQKGSGFRMLDVRVPDHPDWKLRFRRGYTPEAEAKIPKNSTAMTQLSAGVLPKGDLPMRLTAIPLPGASPDMTRVALALEVTAPVRALRDPDGKLRDTLKYEVLAVNEKKARVRSLGGLEGKLTLVPTGRPEDAPTSVSYQVAESVDIPPGRYELRVSATSERLSKGGSVYLDLDVPDLRSPQMSIGGVALTYADGPRVAVAPPAVRRAASPLPFAPTMDRVFTSSDTLRVYFEAISRSQRVSASLDVVDESGRRVLSVVPALVPGDPLRVTDVVPLRSLAPGPYTLRVTLTDGSRTVTRDVGFAVRQP